MNKIAIITICIFAAQIPCVADSNSAMARVRLWKDASVSCSEITLGEIAGITGNAEVVAKLRSLRINPRRHSIRSWQLAQQIADAGFDVSKIYITGAARCKISIEKGKIRTTRKTENSLPVDVEARLAAPSSLEAKIRKLICNNLKMNNLPAENRVKITFNPIVKDLLALTEPPYQFAITPQNRRSNFTGLVGLKVKLYRNSKLVKIVPILAQVSVEAKVLVTNRKINSKAQIGRNDVSWCWKNLNRIRKKLVTSESDLRENRAKTMIHEGTILTYDLLESIPLVKRGQLVTVVYNKSGLEIKTVGKAMKTGLKGEIIPIRNERSKNIFPAKVIGTARVLVDSNANSNSETVDSYTVLPGRQK